MCISLLVSIVLTYYFMLYMMERFNYLMRRQYEDEMYREEMFYKEIYYTEVEKRNECVQNLKHDLKNKLSELYHLAEKGDSKALAEQMGGLCQELGKIDERTYTDNPIVDSVLRIKFGLAKSEGIEIDTAIRIPKQMQLERGDVGVLYGNLLDNAIEASLSLPEEERMIRVYMDIKETRLYLSVTNLCAGRKLLKTGGRFASGKGEGHGFGLIRIDTIVERHGGYLSRNSEDGAFTTEILLPLEQQSLC